MDPVNQDSLDTFSEQFPSKDRIRTFELIVLGSNPTSLESRTVPRYRTCPKAKSSDSDRGGTAGIQRSMSGSN